MFFLFLVRVPLRLGFPRRFLLVILKGRAMRAASLGSTGFSPPEALLDVRLRSGPAGKGLPRFRAPSETPTPPSLSEIVVFDP